MAVTGSTLMTYVNGNPADATFVEGCLVQAQALVSRFIGSAEVPTDVRDRAVLETGSELYHRRQAPLGESQFATPDAVPVRRPRDPMHAAYPLLEAFVGSGIG